MVVNNEITLTHARKQLEELLKQKRIWQKIVNALEREDYLARQHTFPPVVQAEADGQLRLQRRNLIAKPRLQGRSRGKT